MKLASGSGVDGQPWGSGLENETMTDPDDELEQVRERMRLQAEQVAILMDLVSRIAGAGADPQMAEQKLRIFERVLWRHHARLRELQGGEPTTRPKPPTLH
jgi:hypothetical protein